MVQEHATEMSLSCHVREEMSLILSTEKSKKGGFQREKIIIISGRIFIHHNKWYNNNMNIKVTSPDDPKDTHTLTHKIQDAFQCPPITLRASGHVEISYKYLRRVI